MTGLSVAWEAARRGARVRVIDPRGVGAGASGGVVGALAPHAPERWNAKKAFQLRALLAQDDWWAGVIEAGGGDPGYARDGRVQPVADAARAAALAEGAARHWPGHAWVVEAAGDWAPQTPTGQVSRDTLTGRLHPARACDALARAIRARGGAIVAEAAEAGVVVEATGWRGLQAMANAAGRPAGVGIKGQAAVLGLDRRGLPQLYADGLHVVPHGDGTVAVGSTTERDWTEEGATDALLDDVVARARALVPGLRDAPVLARWAGARPRARTRGPVLGPWPGRPGRLVANGGFKIGFGVAPEMARVVADLALEGIDRVPEGMRVEDAL